MILDEDYYIELDITNSLMDLTIFKNWCATPWFNLYDKYGHLEYYKNKIKEYDSSPVYYSYFLIPLYKDK